jgi:transposase
MPDIAILRVVSTGGETMVSFGSRLVFRYQDDDTGMRNLAIVALTDAGVAGLVVAKVFGLSAPYVSRIRGEARRSGAQGLVKRRGRPRKLSDRQVAMARRLACEGSTHATIAKRFGVARSVISDLLAKSDPVPAQEALGLAAVGEGVEDNTADAMPLEDMAPGARVVNKVKVVDPPAETQSGEEIGTVGLARIGVGEHPSRYAGAALLYPYLSMVAASDIFSTLVGGPARRYDDLSVLSSAVMGFALGIDTVEGSKHLRRADAGALVGVSALPELRTLRARLSALADDSDPLALQRAFAKATLAADPSMSPVYYVDDHFVAYTGARPVAKGYNTKRRHAESGRDDTLVCDVRGRAVVFASSEPSGLSATMPSVLAQLREVVGPDQPIMLGFDRGGSYPKAFTACRDAGMDWITYRRGKLAPVTARVTRSWAMRGERRVVVHVAAEVIDIAGYGQARQLTLFERGEPVLQVLTSDMKATGAALLAWLRGRWSIENLFKYASEHNGIDSISSYLVDIGPDNRRVDNPERKKLRARVRDAESTLAAAERALGRQNDARLGDVEEYLATIRTLRDDVTIAKDELDEARQALKGIPAKVLVTELDPSAKRAKLRIERRGLQMVCRLLAFNAEAWLAEHFEAYLSDPNEYRAIMRNLLHLPGSFSYGHKTITVMLERPDTPRVARALELLVEELNNASSPCLLGDRRPLVYQVAGAA